MANWRSFGDRMLYYHRSMLKTWWNRSDLASFQYSRCARGGGLFLGGPVFKKAAPFSPIGSCCCCCSSSSSPPVSSPVSSQSLSSSPLLMIPPGVDVMDDKNLGKYSDNENNDFFHFFSLSKQSQFRVGKNLSIPWQRELLTPNDAVCVGSSHGWLAFNHPVSCHPYLYNPLIDSPHFPYIPLPSIETLPSVRGVRLIKSDHLSPSPSLITQFLISFQNNNIHIQEEGEGTDERSVGSHDISYYYVRRIVMSSAPSLGNDCTIMAIHSESSHIAFCKPGDERWTALECSLPRFSDIVYFSKDERFYARSIDGSIEAWDLRDPSCPKNQVFDSPHFCPGKFAQKIGNSYNCNETRYLVDSSGDLLLVCRFVAASVAKTGVVHPRRLELVNNNNNDNEEWENYFINDDDAYWTLGFDVHKFNFDQNKWEYVECLGDRALFVGSNYSFSLSTLDYPELMGNSIYFTDSCLRGGYGDIYSGHDNGVFHLQDDCIKSYYPSRLKIIDPHPVWVAPNTLM